MLCEQWFAHFELEQDSAASYSALLPQSSGDDVEPLLTPAPPVPPVLPAPQAWENDPITAHAGKRHGKPGAHRGRLRGYYQEALDDRHLRVLARIRH